MHVTVRSGVCHDTIETASATTGPVQTQLAHGPYFMVTCYAQQMLASHPKPVLASLALPDQRGAGLVGLLLGAAAGRAPRPLGLVPHEQALRRAETMAYSTDFTYGPPLEV